MTIKHLERERTIAPQSANGTEHGLSWLFDLPEHMNHMHPGAATPDAPGRPEDEDDRYLYLKQNSRFLRERISEVPLGYRIRS